jgi:hypothetical protein
LEHTKKPHTKITLHFEGPVDKKNDAINALMALGFRNAGTDSVSWRDSFAELIENEPGNSLAGARHKENLTQVNLSKLTKIPQRHISEMENGKRPIGKENAKKIAKVLNVNFRVFL